MKKLIALFSVVLLGAPVGGYAAAQVGEAAPRFTLPDTSGKDRSLSDFKGKWVVLEWVNHGCPFVKKHYDSGNMQRLQKEYTGKGVIWLSICSSAEGKQGYFPAGKWDQLTEQKKASPTAVLLDPSGKVGHLYGAKTTPHMFIINPEGELVYAGAIDNKASTDKADIQRATNYVSAALDSAMAGKPVEVSTSKPYGCSVKY